MSIIDRIKRVIKGRVEGIKAMQKIFELASLSDIYHTVLVMLTQMQDETGRKLEQYIKSKSNKWEVEVAGSFIGRDFKAKGIIDISKSLFDPYFSLTVETKKNKYYLEGYLPQVYNKIRELSLEDKEAKVVFLAVLSAYFEGLIRPKLLEMGYKR